MTNLPPIIHSLPNETSQSHGLRPHNFACIYHPDRRVILIYDFFGYVGFVRTPEELWACVQLGGQTLREITKLPHSESRLPTPSPKTLTLEDLGL